MPSDLNDIVKGSQIMVFVVQSSKYSTHIVEIARAAVALGRGVCYISLNKPYQVIQKSLQLAGVPTEGVRFVDAVSSKVGSATPAEGVIFVSSPQALTELNIAVNKCMGAKEGSVVLFDSLSTLLLYEQSSSVVKFVHSVISTLRVKGNTCIFTILKDDLKEELMKDLSMFADKMEELI